MVVLWVFSCGWVTPGLSDGCGCAQQLPWVVAVSCVDVVLWLTCVVVWLAAAFQGSCHFVAPMPCCGHD
jgi:hypothetical protein